MLKRYDQGSLRSNVWKYGAIVLLASQETCVVVGSRVLFFEN